MRNIFLDIDDTLLYTRKAFCEIYNEKYKYHPEFKIACPEDIYQWDLKDACPLQDDVFDIFSHEKFYEIAEPFEDMIEVLENLSKKTDIFLCSNWNLINFIWKSKWIHKHLPFAAWTILMTPSKNTKFHKWLVNMEWAIFVDDSVSNLNKSNAEIKICFAIKDYQCNEWWDWLRTNNWKELWKMIEKYLIN